MRFLVTGTDGQGRGCVVKQEDIHGRAEKLVYQKIFETLDGVTGSTVDSTGSFRDIAPAGGEARWGVVTFPPGAVHPPHHTRSIDFDTVLSGSIDLGLDDGDYRLEAGDSVVINGVDHGWRVGPEGCTMTVLALGVAQRD